MAQGFKRRLPPRPQRHSRPKAEAGFAMLNLCIPGQGTRIGQCDIGALACDMQAHPMEDALHSDVVYPIGPKWAHATDLYDTMHKAPVLGSRAGAQESRMSFGAEPL